jgi:hypothetical protein
VLAALIASLVAGCGVSDPYNVGTTTSHTAGRTTTSTIAPHEHDGPGPGPTAGVPVGATQASPAAALSRYAWLYVNWSWQTMPAHERQLADLSVGQAHAQALAAAAVSKVMLARYAVHNQGQVVALARGEGAERGRWAVITNEQTGGDGPYEGLPATSHVTWAMVRREGPGWVVSGWYPGS